MSNEETLQTNNERLNENNGILSSILNTINNLPDAGSGEDIDEELRTQDNKLTTQETSINDIIEALKGKAMNGEGDEEMVKYSLEEQVIGEWISGKPVYRRTFYSPNIATITTGIDTMETVVNAYGVGKLNGTSFLPLAFYNTGGWNSFHIISNGQRIIIEKNSTNYVLTDIYITVEYTKTTD